ncbi:TetR/AcrR family transcriptional regulator [Marinobacter sp. F3R08]|uniref:TetR/AcrR family transcriptional regulator n=1 Tax=Marinobacter sp. F3R08 TaxID=2841559 RepID=UPI001C0A47E2|nr:TetR/AcrR family transcriptional regulator [Marinobacter sp. F3R08]MBU2955936.1 TetR/AcrR family transcriptional regulator [Marinobacter sp. F3R08]
MQTRIEKKEESRRRILTAASKRLRIEGLGGAGVASVMDDAGLTHGAFYSHFANKDELARRALEQATRLNRNRWTGRWLRGSWADRLSTLAKRYLTGKHRDNLADSCALATLCSEAARGDKAFRSTYENELTKTLSAIADEDFDQLDPAQADDIIAFMSLIVGSMALSRAVDSSQLSDRILQVGRDSAGRLASVNLQKPTYNKESTSHE